MQGIRTFAPVIGLAGLGMGAAALAGAAARDRGDASRWIATGTALGGSAAVTFGLAQGGRSGALAAAVGAGLVIGSLVPLLAGIPASGRASGPGTDHKPEFHVPARDLAIGWWPVQMGLSVDTSGNKVFRFTSLVANLGANTMSVDGARMEYAVYRRRSDGTFAEQVGAGSAALDQLETTQYPPPFGAEIGRPLETFGDELTSVKVLDPATAGVIGSGQRAQQINLGAAPDGLYVLRQRIVHGPQLGGDDAPHDDVRDTEFMIRNGVAIELGSRYAD